MDLLALKDNEVVLRFSTAGFVAITNLLRVIGLGLKHGKGVGQTPVASERHQLVYFGR